MRSGKRLTASAAAAASSAAILGLIALGAPAHAAVQPPCLTDTCPTASATPSPTPTDGSDDSGAIATAPPAQPTDSTTDGPTDPTGVNATPPAPTQTPTGENPQHNYCDPGGFYEPNALGGKYIRGVGATQSDYNHTSQTASVTFSAQASATIGASFSGQLQVSENAAIVKANETYNVGFSASLTASLGNSISVNVAPYHTMNAEYGVWRRKVTGISGYLYSNCAENYHTVVMYGPYRVGWYLWEG